MVVKKKRGGRGGATGIKTRESKQDEKIGKAAKSAKVPKANLKGYIANLEEKKSRSASKTRERYRSKKK